MPTERREHRRAQLKLPVRLRWPGPLRQLTEVSETLDVCRGGLLVRSSNDCRSGAPLWVTFPYDSSLSANLPEVPARIARVERRSDDGLLIAIHLEPYAYVNGSGPKPLVERRRSPRVPISVPVALRTGSSPWAEETMTLDISSRGMRLSTFRVYSEGENVRITLQPGPVVSAWPVAREVPARIVRIEPIPGSSQWHVALRRLP